MRLIKHLDLVLKNDENGTVRVTGLRLCRQGMGGDDFLCLVVVSVQRPQEEAIDGTWDIVVLQG